MALSRNTACLRSQAPSFPRRAKLPFGLSPLLGHTVLSVLSEPFSAFCPGLFPSSPRTGADTACLLGTGPPSAFASLHPSVASVAAAPPHLFPLPFTSERPHWSAFLLRFSVLDLIILLLLTSLRWASSLVSPAAHRQAHLASGRTFASLPLLAPSPHHLTATLTATSWLVVPASSPSPLGAAWNTAAGSILKH